MPVTNVKSTWSGGDLSFSGSGSVNFSQTGDMAVSPLVTLAKGLLITPLARTATADGTGTGTVTDGYAWVTVTSADANNIIVLPTPTPGTIVILTVGATGYELRSSAPATVAINGGSGASAESAIPANSTVIAFCETATSWRAIQIGTATAAGVEAAL